MLVSNYRTHLQKKKLLMNIRQKGMSHLWSWVNKAYEYSVAGIWT